MIRAKNLSDSLGIKHLFLTRQGGVSQGIYAGLNCGPGSNDHPAHVAQNRARAMAAMDLEPDALVTAYQIHSSIVIEVEEPWSPDAPPKADGLVTSAPGIALGVLSADCVPVLFADPRSGVIGAAHSGWKGALGGVLEATIDHMEEIGAERHRIDVAIGPCIMQTSYEVGGDFRSSFLEAAYGNERFFAPGVSDRKYQFDLAGYVVHRLSEAEVGSIELLGLDTYADPDRFFSYRRSTHNNEPDYGRMLSAIALEGE